jgi:hypothetical protein
VEDVERSIAIVPWGDGVWIVQKTGGFSLEFVEMPFCPANFQLGMNQSYF